MKSKLPLTSEEVVKLICDENDGFAMKLHKEIAYRNESANYSVMHCCKTLASDVKVVRIRQEIIDAVRRIGLECSHCKEKTILGDWHILNDETLLECPRCSHLTPRLKHKDAFVLEDIFPLVPLHLQDLFAQK